MYVHGGLPFHVEIVRQYFHQFFNDTSRGRKLAAVVTAVGGWLRMDFGDALHNDTQTATNGQETDRAR